MSTADTRVEHKDTSLTQEEKFHFYKQVSAALYWQESRHHKWKWKNQQYLNKIKRCIGAEAQDKKICWNNTKTNEGCNFQYTQFSVIDLVLTDRRNLSGTQPKSACGKSSSCWLLFSGVRNAISEANRYIIFSFTFHILVFFPFKESLNIALSRQYIFFNFLAAMIQKYSDKQPWINYGEGMWKNTIFFHCVVMAILRAGNCCVTP